MEDISVLSMRAMMTLKLTFHEVLYVRAIANVVNLFLYFTCNYNLSLIKENQECSFSRSLLCPSTHEGSLLIREPEVLMQIERTTVPSILLLWRPFDRHKSVPAFQFLVYDVHSLCDFFSDRLFPARMVNFQRSYGLKTVKRSLGVSFVRRVRAPRV